MTTTSIDHTSIDHHKHGHHVYDHHKPKADKDTHNHHTHHPHGSSRHELGLSLDAIAHGADAEEVQKPRKAMPASCLEVCVVS